jgi:hypothetical protein
LPVCYLKGSGLPGYYRFCLSFPVVFPDTTHLPSWPTPANMSDPVEVKSYGGAPHAEKAISQVEDASNLDEKAQIAHNKAAAIEAENVEHNMGVPEAVKAYPMAAWWAFVMSCTIVRRLSSITLNISR